MATQLPLPKNGAPPPIFGPCLLWPNGWMDQDATLYDGRPIGTGNIVLDADPAPPPPQVSAHVCCGQMAGWINMPLGTKVGLGPGRIVLHGDHAPSAKRGTAPPIFGPCLLWPSGRPSQQLLSTCSLGLLSFLVLSKI